MSSTSSTTRLAAKAATLALVLVSAAAVAAERQLIAVQFPERSRVGLAFARAAAAPRAALSAEVEVREGLAEIDVSFEGMKPAVLFGGDVTSFVLWAVTREGGVVNLGELWVREARDNGHYTTGLKEFALIVTAEAHPLVDRPSELVMFTSGLVDSARARNTEFAFADFAPAPRTARSGIADVPVAEGTEPDLEQARKAFELAERAGAPRYAAKLMSEARITLAQATNLARGKGMRDYARRTVALASEAIRTTERSLEAERLEQEIARRRAETEALLGRAAAAEAAARRAEEAARAVEQQRADLEARMATARAAIEGLAGERAHLEAETARLSGETARLGADKATLESSMLSLRAEREGLLAEREALAAEKQRLAERLKGALDQVASTAATARGMIVNLSDILFDTGEATLRPEARVALAKLSGILLMMPELNLRIEGHTDSTGGAALNLRLSERRADAVFDLLAGQGVSATRMKAVGYGMERPVADNATADGRARNRRVEIVIAEGEVQEAQ